MYAGTNIEICALEKFVHLSGAAHPPLVIVSIDVPDNIYTQPAMADLPADWADLPSPPSAQEFGRQWLDAKKELLMFLPSAVIPETVNALINPNHPAYADVSLTIVRDFTFDARMFK